MNQQELNKLIDSYDKNLYEYNGKQIHAATLPKDVLKTISQNFGVRKVADAENVSATIYAIESGTTHFVATKG